MNTIKLGDLVLGGKPKIAVSFTDNSGNIEQYLREGLDIAEVRIDQFAKCDKEHVASVIKKFGNVPVIATIRSKSEGGLLDISDEDRLKIFKGLMPLVGAVDVELKSESILGEVVNVAHKQNKLAIISHHNFKVTPKTEDLNDMLKECESKGADIIKIATFINDSDDLKCLAAFTLANEDKNIIIIGMGEQGLSSRIFFPTLGSLITFAYADKATAPGQLSFAETKEYIKRFY